jgi:hypothetical protein
MPVAPDALHSTAQTYRTYETYLMTICGLCLRVNIALQDVTLETPQ